MALGNQQAGSTRQRVVFLLTVYCLLIALCSILASPARAHDDDRPPALRGVALEQKLGEQLPLGLGLQDDRGRTVHLGEYFVWLPVILTFAFYQCQDLC